MEKMGRRNFVKGAAILSGAVACGALNAGAALATPTQAELPPLPWGYQELDPEELRKLGHLGYYAYECSGGVFWALVTALKEKIGYPYTAIATPTKEEVIHYLKNKKNGAHLPPMFMQYGVGGVADYGTLCGAPNGAASLINIAVPMEAAKKEIIPRLLRYYETEAFPTDLSNQYAMNGEFYPPKYKSAKALPQIVGDSVLCHISVGTWCEKSGYASGSKERSERCGRITGDVAAMVVKLLNATIHDNLPTVFPMGLSQETAECRTCHSKGKEYETGQFTRGSMECSSCHDETTVHKGENKLKTAYGIDVGKWAGAAVVGTVAGIGSHAVASRLSKEDSNDEE